MTQHKILPNFTFTSNGTKGLKSMALDCQKHGANWCISEKAQLYMYQ